MSIFRSFNISMIPGKPPLIIHVSQYESDFVYTFNLVSGKSVLAIPDTAIAVIRGTKRDGNGYSVEAALDAENHKVVVMGDPQLTACAGRNVFELAIINDEKVICTANFYLDVERAPLDAGTIQSESVLRELQAIINSAATATQAAEEASASAAEAAESARTLTIDPTLTQSGQPADAYETGRIKSNLNQVYSCTTFTKDAVGGQVFPYTIKTGVLYIVTNLTDNNTVGVRTCDSSGTEIEVIKTGIAYNESVLFVASKDADYIRIYSGVVSTSVSINTNGLILNGIDTKIRANTEKVEKITKKLDFLYLGMKKYVLPSGFNYDSPVSIYYDGYHFVTDFNAENYKNTGNGVWYVSPNGSGSGTSRKDPTQFVIAYNSASNGDTIILLEGKYYRGIGGYVMPKITKSVNVIAEGNGALMIDGNYSTFTAVSGYTGVYSASRSLTRRVIDTSIDGKYFAYQIVNSIQEVADTEGSCYIDGDTVYVHAIDGGDPTGKVCCCIEYENTFDVDNSKQDVRLYVENVTLVGKYNGILINRKNASGNLDVCFNNVSVILCGNTTQNAINVRGGNAVFNNCKVISAYKDGINYTGINTLSNTCECSGLEINCVAAGCGKEQADNTQNGSTAHSGSKVLRINGRYYDNKGASVADVHENTQSVNLGCIAYAPDCEGLYSQNFSTQQAGAEMWLDSCIASGGQYDVFCYTGSTMHVKNTGYNTASEYTGATLDVTHKRDVTEMMLLCGCILR